jgi:hypothetical protein
MCEHNRTRSQCKQCGVRASASTTAQDTTASNAAGWASVSTAV